MKNISAAQAKRIAWMWIGGWPNFGGVWICVETPDGRALIKRGLIVSDISVQMRNGYREERHVLSPTALPALRDYLSKVTATAEVPHEVENKQMVKP